MDQAGGKAKEGANAMRRFLARLEELDTARLEEESGEVDTANEIARLAREEGAPAAAVAHIRATLELALDPGAAPQVAVYNRYMDKIVASQQMVQYVVVIVFWSIHYVFVFWSIHYD